MGQKHIDWANDCKWDLQIRPKLLFLETDNRQRKVDYVLPFQKVLSKLPYHCFIQRLLEGDQLVINALQTSSGEPLPLFVKVMFLHYFPYFLIGGFQLMPSIQVGTQRQA